MRKRVRTCAMVLLFAVPCVHADEMPVFRVGNWEFVRTVDTGIGKPQVSTSSRCASPTDDMKRQNEKLAQLGCKLGPATRVGLMYVSSAQCVVNGVPAESKSVVTVESDSAYSQRVESRHGAQGSIETLKARRTGDCK